MEVVLQDLENRRFLSGSGDWVPGRAKARVFTDSLQAISFCIQRNVRMVRLVAMRESDGQEIYFYPFGHDPVAKAERRSLRRGLQKSRRLKHERRMIQARIDMLLAESKERRKQVPFKPKAAGDEKAGSA